jgi:hypothetical protein
MWIYLKQPKGRTLDIGDVTTVRRADKGSGSKSGRYALEMILPVTLFGEEWVNVNNSEELSKSIEVGVLAGLLEKEFIEISEQSPLEDSTPNNSTTAAPPSSTPPSSPNSGAIESKLDALTDAVTKMAEALSATAVRPKRKYIKKKKGKKKSATKHKGTSTS